MARRVGLLQGSHGAWPLTIRPSCWLDMPADLFTRITLPPPCRFSCGTMTALFIQRLFAQHCASSSGCGSGSGGGGGMDYTAFATFSAAWEQRHHPAALRYLFAVLDLEGRGYITTLELHAFFREVHALWIQVGGQCPAPAVPACRCWHTVLPPACSAHGLPCWRTSLLAACRHPLRSWDSGQTGGAGRERSPRARHPLTDWLTCPILPCSWASGQTCG